MKSLAFYNERDRDLSDIEYDLVGCLRAGSLALMIGAGASRDLGLPLWNELAAACLESQGFGEEASKLKTTSQSSQDVLDQMGLVRRKLGDPEYFALIHKCLYNQPLPSPVNSPALLRAIGALCMGSRRGRVSEIINYNFDCVLESYFRYHGYVSQVISSFPFLTTESDIRLWHPHGYVPSEQFDGKLGHNSDRLIFDCDTADDFASNRSEPWMDVSRFLFGTKVFVALGLSGTDPITNLVLSAASSRLVDDRPLGFWFYKKGSIDASRLEKIKSRKFVPVGFADFSEYPEFLFQVCMRAADATMC